MSKNSTLAVQIALLLVAAFVSWATFSYAGLVLYSFHPTLMSIGVRYFKYYLKKTLPKSYNTSPKISVSGVSVQCTLINDDWKCSHSKASVCESNYTSLDPSSVWFDSYHDGRRSHLCQQGKKWIWTFHIITFETRLGILCWIDSRYFRRYCSEV